MDQFLTALVSVVATLTSAKAWDYYTKKLNTKTNTLDRKDSELALWRAELKERVGHLEAQVADLLAENAKLLAEVHALTNLVSQLRDENRRLNEDTMAAPGKPQPRARVRRGDAPVEVRPRKPRSGNR
jgi:hypothetical protein